MEAIRLRFKMTNQDHARAGRLDLNVRRTDLRDVVIHRIQIFAGDGDDAVEVRDIPTPNLYLVPGHAYFEIKEDFDAKGRDVIQLWITGTPEGGLEQIHKTWFRLPVEGPPIQLVGTELPIWYVDWPAEKDPTSWSRLPPTQP